MDVPAVFVLTRRVEVLEMPGECLFGMPVLSQHLVRVDPGNGPAAKHDR